MFDHLYIHVPFCAAKCAYCAFYSDVDADIATQRAWLNKITEDLRGRSTSLEEIQTVFIGGGTPTFLKPAELEGLLAALHAAVSGRGIREFTIECNPESLTAKKAAILARGGVNRVSLGVQSFSQPLRQALGRQGTAESATRAIDLLKTAGVHNYGMDLIYGIPGQTVADWERDARQACEMGVSSLSAYALTLEEGARLAQKDAVTPDDDLIADMWELTGDVCAEYGLHRYEVSNYAIPGKECLHNLGIWQGGSYLGLGPAASSFEGVSRWTQPPDLQAWLDGTPPARDDLSARKRACELLAFGLRTVDGWNKERFSKLTGVSPRELREREIADLISQELLEESASHLRPTTKGLLFADTVAVALL